MYVYEIVAVAADKYMISTNVTINHLWLSALSRNQPKVTDQTGGHKPDTTCRVCNIIFFLGESRELSDVVVVVEDIISYNIVIYIYIYKTKMWFVYKTSWANARTIALTTISRKEIHGIANHTGRARVPAIQ